MRLCCKDVFLLMCFCPLKELSDLSFYPAQLSECCLLCFLHIPHGCCNSRGIVVRTVNSPAPWKFLLAQVKRKQGLELGDFKRVK